MEIQRQRWSQLTNEQKSESPSKWSKGCEVQGKVVTKNVVCGEIIGFL